MIPYCSRPREPLDGCCGDLSTLPSRPQGVIVSWYSWTGSNATSSDMILPSCDDDDDDDGDDDDDALQN